MSKRSYVSSFGPLASGFRAYKKTKSVPMVALRRNRAPRIKGAIRPVPELKYVDVGVQDYTADTTGSVTLLNGVAIGDENTQRDGKQITVKSVQINGIARPETTSNGALLGRVMIVWDNAANGALAAAGDILETVNSTSFPDVNNSQRFTILSDTKFALGVYNTTATSAVGDQTAKLISVYKKLNSVTQYSGTTNGIASIQNGALLLLCVGNAAYGATINMDVRVRYTDN